jgi:pimeloyl-ACP methyl ester carboxylesterase
VTSGQGIVGFAERHLDLSPGVSLRYFVAGSGPVLLLVHGLGGSALNWVAVAPALASRHRVVVPDLPGHGRSGPLPHPSGASLFADDLAELIRREEAAPVVVVGHSLGGLVALRLAIRHPDLVGGVLLAAAAGISSGRKAARVALEILAVFRPARLLASYRARIAGSPLLRRVVFGWWGASDPAQLQPWMVEGLLAGWELHTDTLSAARAMVSDDVRTDLEHVRCPCLVVWGARDHQVGVGDGFEYARRLCAPLRVIPDCGHLLIVERPDTVLAAVGELLDGIRELDELPVESEALG